MPTRLLYGVLVLAIGGGWLSAQERPLPPGFTVTPVLDNRTVGVVKLQLATGARETLHTHPYAMLVVFLSRGDAEMQNGTARTRGPRTAGDLEFVAAGVSHAAANLGTEPLDALVVAVKADRLRGEMAPPPQPLPGLSRTSMIDNSEMTVTRLEFEPGVRETVHTHPYDLLVVPITPARLDMQVGDKKSLQSYAKGEATFIPRGVPHATANAGATPCRVLVLAIK